MKTAPSVHRFDWMDDASCLKFPPEAWDLPSHGALSPENCEAKKVCARCPVRGQCLREAIRLQDTYVIRGGKEFRKIKSRKGAHIR